MKHLKHSFILLLALFCSAIYAQNGEWIPAKVILKNGTSFRGFVKFPYSSSTFRSADGQWEQKFDLKKEELTYEYEKNENPFSLTISTNSRKIIFRKTKKSPKIKYDETELEEVVFGDEQFAVERYRFVSVTDKKSLIMQIIMEGKVNLYKAKSIYYVKKDKEKTATIISKKGVSDYISLINAKAYFSDCEKIIYYLENDLYRYDNIEELVDDYNLLCD